MNEKLKEYFKNDEIAMSVWLSKYCLKDKQGNPLEETPDDMHHRMATEFARVEEEWKLKKIKEKGVTDESWDLSDYGFHLEKLRDNQTFEDLEQEFFELFKDFKWIIPQGSVMSILGNPYMIGSLSNCYTCPSPIDSYSGIMQTDQHLVQLMKRRAGVGTNLNLLRPENTHVSNAAGTSTGAWSFMERYSNTTREVAQSGRRGR
jgi:ribonucleoside-diphosphate reductase alpha chain